MRIRSLVVAGCLCAKPTFAAAEAEPELGYVTVGGLVSGDVLANVAAVLAGGWKLGTLPVWAHAAVAIGSSGDGEGTGEFRRGRAGIEVRTGASEDPVAVFASFDLGYQTQQWSGNGDRMEHHRGLLLGPRLGLDAGSAHTRVRLTVDAYGYDHRSDVGDPQAGWQRAIGFELAVLYRL